MMQIGLASTDFERDFAALPLRDIFSFTRDYGYSCTQLSLSTVKECGFTPTGNFDIPASIPAGLAAKILQAAEETDISVAALNGTFNAAHPDRAVRTEGLRRFEALVSLAKEISAPIITLCSGTCCETDMWTPHPENNTQEAFDRTCEAMEEMARLAEAAGIYLAIEPEASNIVNTPEKACALLARIGSPSLKMIMDGANLFHMGAAYKENVRPTLEHAFHLLGNTLILAHGKDIREGPGIDFCPTFEGILDFAYMRDRLAACGFLGPMIVHGVYDTSKMAEICARMKTLFP